MPLAVSKLSAMTASPVRPCDATGPVTVVVVVVDGGGLVVVVVVLFKRDLLELSLVSAEVPLLAPQAVTVSMPMIRAALVAR